AWVIPDAADILQAINNDLRTTSAQVDGIIGVSLLSRLQVEIDSPGSRVIAHCRCESDPSTCRTYRRFTTRSIDDCTRSGDLCIKDRGLVPPASCAMIR